ncbi:MAG: hypothetical protein L6V91_09790 [Bacilli bacterium]|nr:MAG: hypothetical protein L6V91_09790 [Bacilli bacterium]
MLSSLVNRNGLMTPCGHDMAHLLHSIQFSGIQLGITSAMFLFSYLVVPPSKIPPATSRKLLVGNVSPFSRFIVSLKFNFFDYLGILG